MRSIRAETRWSFAHFVTLTCAIVRGTLTIASIVDNLASNNGAGTQEE